MDSGLNNSRVLGTEIIMESLRQKCTYKTGFINYYNYMKKNFQKCNSKFIENCFQNVIYYEEINLNKLQACVRDSFKEVHKNYIEKNNDILQMENEKLRKLNMQFFPSVLVNGVLYKGFLSFSDLVFILCTIFTRKFMNARIWIYYPMINNY